MQTIKIMHFFMGQKNIAKNDKYS